MAGDSVPSMTDQPAPTVDELRAYSFVVFSQLQGFLIAGTIHLGERLGLYRALAAAEEPVTAAELAAATGLHERWVREWLRAQGAARLLEHHGDERFSLPAAGAAVLADPSSLFYAAGAFRHLPKRAEVFTSLRDSFRTGIGHPYDAMGPEGAESVEAMFSNWYRHMLVPVMLPALDGVVDKLTAGATVADVGCGAGVALLTMAVAYPASTFHGYEASVHAIERAEANRSAAGVDNVTFHHVADEPLPADGSIDFLLTLDCVHDMTRPTEVVGAIRRALAEDGTWLWAEPKALPRYEDNVERNPMAALMYGMSVVSCMASALSEPGGEGLGTLGIPEPRAREMAAAAGFTRFEVHDFGNPVNTYFEVRP